MKKWLTDRQLSLQLPPLTELLQRYPQGQPQKVQVEHPPGWQNLAQWILRCYDIRNDDRVLRAAPCKAETFDALRANYAVRSELNQLHLDTTGQWANTVAWQQRFAQLTFQTTN